MDTSPVALTAHLVMPDRAPDDAFLRSATDGLHDRFEITHVTLQEVRVPFTRPCGSWQLKRPERVRHWFLRTTTRRITLTDLPGSFAEPYLEAGGRCADTA